MITIIERPSRKEQGMTTDQSANVAPCRNQGDDEHNNVCPFCDAMPQARCRYEDRETYGC